MVKRHPYILSVFFIFFLCIFIFLTSSFCSRTLVRASNSFFDLNEKVYDADIVGLRLEGPIVESRSYLKLIDKIRKSKRVKAVVFRVDSPGGNIGESEEIFRELLKLKQEKILIVSMGSIAASGGYYIALAGQKIIALDSTITGSIGVVMPNLGFKELMDWAKIKDRSITSGTYKYAGSPSKEMSEAEKAYLQSFVNELYDQFVMTVAKHRGFSKEKAYELAEGKVYTGRTAKKLGLIDETGNLHDAIELTRKMAKLPENATIIWPQDTEDKSFFWLRSQLSQLSLLKEANHLFKNLNQDDYRGAPSFLFSAPPFNPQ